MDAGQFTGHGVVVHASARFPIVRTVCGRSVDPPPCPAADRWSLVDCLDCLRIGAWRSPDPRVRWRFEKLSGAVLQVAAAAGAAPRTPPQAGPSR